MSKSPRIKTLNEEIYIVQLDSYVDKFDTEMGKENKKTKKWLKIAFIPFGVCVGFTLITLNTIPLVIGTTYLSTVSIIKLLKDGKEDEKRFKKKFEQNNIKELYSDIADFDFLNEPIVTVKAEDYHSDYFKQKLSEAAKKNRFTLIDSNGKVIGGVEPTSNDEEESQVLDLEETMIRISEEYRTYQIVYNLPELTIKNKEWDILFETVFHKLEESSKEDKLYEYMSFLLRYVIAYALVKNKKEISYTSFTDQICRLEYMGIKKEDIKDIIKKLNSYKTPPKIISFDTSKLSKK